MAKRQWPAVRTDHELSQHPADRQDRSVSLRRSRPLAGGGEGLEPVFHRLDSRREGIAPVIALIERAIGEEGLDPRQIAVLTSTKELTERLHATMVWKHQFAPVGKAVGMVADTVHRFKGPEAACVVVVLGPEVERGGDEQLRELNYVAYSRATAVLHVFAPKGFRR